MRTLASCQSPPSPGVLRMGMRASRSCIHRRTTARACIKRGPVHSRSATCCPAIAAPCGVRYCIRREWCSASVCMKSVLLVLTNNIGLLPRLLLKKNRTDHMIRRTRKRVRTQRHIKWIQGVRQPSKAANRPCIILIKRAALLNTAAGDVARLSHCQRNFHTVGRFIRAGALIFRLSPRAFFRAGRVSAPARTPV